MPLSAFQDYKNTKKTEVEFTTLTSKRTANKKIVKNIAIDIFDKLFYTKFSENESIENIDKIYSAEKSKFQLFKFEPKTPIFSFLNLLRFKNLSSEATFTLDGFLNLDKIEISYSLMQINEYKKSFKNKVVFTFDSNYKLNNIIYNRYTVGEGLETLLKTSDMICPDEEESFLIELFLLQQNPDFLYMFKDYYIFGNSITHIEQIQAKKDILKMLYI